MITLYSCSIIVDINLMEEFQPLGPDKILQLAKHDEEGVIVDLVNLWRTIELNPKVGRPLLFPKKECTGTCNFILGVDIENKFVTFCGECLYYERGRKILEN